MAWLRLCGLVFDLEVQFSSAMIDRSVSSTFLGAYLRPYYRHTSKDRPIRSDYSRIDWTAQAVPTLASTMSMARHNYIAHMGMEAIRER